MRKVRELIAKASQDFELAKMHKQVREYVTATMLYNRAVEKILTALFISRTKREPPKNASIDYLARKNRSAGRGCGVHNIPGRERAGRDECEWFYGSSGCGHGCRRGRKEGILHGWPCKKAS